MQRYGVCVLVAIAVTACSVTAVGVRFSDEQASALAEEALRHTPEFTHFARGAHFDWVVFAPEQAGNYPEATAAIREALASRYTVYVSEEDLPLGALRREGSEVGFVGGFRYTVDIQLVDKATIQVRFSDTEGPLAGGSQTIRYRWRRGKWVQVWQGPRVVA